VPAQRVKIERQQRSAELLTRREAAEYLGVAAQTLAIWQTTGRYRLPVVKVGKLVRYRLADLDFFLSSRTLNVKSTAGSGQGRREQAETKAPLEKAKQQQANKEIVEFAQVHLVDLQSRKNAGQPEKDVTTELEIIFPSGVKLRLTPGCSLDWLSSVITMLENS
jgi:excisionase family DNA binding protein